MQIVMSWIETMLNVYWELRPCYETQELYKAHKLQAFDYWKMELEYLTCSTWTNNKEFQSLPHVSYLMDKYSCEKIRLDREDRISLGTAFLIDLGMNPKTFPVKIL